MEMGFSTDIEDFLFNTSIGENKFPRSMSHTAGKEEWLMASSPHKEMTPPFMVLSIVEESRKKVAAPGFSVHCQHDIRTQLSPSL